MATVGIFTLSNLFGHVTLNLDAGAEVLDVIWAGGRVSAVVRSPDGASTSVTKMTFYLVGNTQDVPNHAKYVGTVLDPEQGNWLMVFVAPTEMNYGIAP